MSRRGFYPDLQGVEEEDREEEREKPHLQQHLTLLLSHKLLPLSTSTALLTSVSRGCKVAYQPCPLHPAVAPLSTPVSRRRFYPDLQEVEEEDREEEREKPHL